MFRWGVNEGKVLPISLFITILITVIIVFLLRKKSENIRRIPLIIITTIMLLLEVVKQVYFLCTGYDLWALPLHFCSLSLYFFSFASYGKGRLRRLGDVFALSGTIVVLIAFLISPQNIIGHACDNVFATFLTFHTFAYHHLMFLYYFILVGSHLIKPQLSDIKYLIIIVLAYSIVAIIAGYSLNVNFCSVLYNNYSFLEAIRQACGPQFYLVCLVIFGSLALTITYLPHILITKIKKKK